MSKKKTIADLLSSCNSKTPVEDTVVKRWNDIIASMANGWSLPTIAETLRAEGEHVGNDKNTGFTTAVNRVAARKKVDLHLVKAADPAVIARAVNPNMELESVARRISSTQAAASGGRLPSTSQNDVEPSGPLIAALPRTEGAAAATQPSFADTRFPSDF